MQPAQVQTIIENNLLRSVPAKRLTYLQYNCDVMLEKQAKLTRIQSLAYRLLYRVGPLALMYD